MNKYQRELHGKVSDAETALEHARATFLKQAGWTYESDRLMCLWVWSKTIAPGSWVARWNAEHPTLKPMSVEPTTYCVTRAEAAVVIQTRAWDAGHDEAAT